MDILFILKNSWFDYIGDQRKSKKKMKHPSLDVKVTTRHWILKPIHCVGDRTLKKHFLTYDTDNHV